MAWQRVPHSRGSRSKRLPFQARVIEQQSVGRRHFTLNGCLLEERRLGSVSCRWGTPHVDRQLSTSANTCSRPTAVVHLSSFSTALLTLITSLKPRTTTSDYEADFGRNQKSDPSQAKTTSSLNGWGADSPCRIRVIYSFSSPASAASSGRNFDTNTQCDWLKHLITLTNDVVDIGHILDSNRHNHRV